MIGEQIAAVAAVLLFGALAVGAVVRWITGDGDGELLAVAIAVPIAVLVINHALAG